MNDQQRYLLNVYAEQEFDLKTQRRYVPIILGDENDAKKSGGEKLFYGICATLIEFGLASFCFTNIFNLDWRISLLAGLILAAVLPLGFKLILEHFYDKAQNAANAALHARLGE